jgi:hypothetical protein
MARDIQAVINEILAQCEYENDYSIANPLRDFSRTGGKENYSAGDIMVDLKRQLEDGKDIPDAMVDRWNRLFREWPEIQIEFRDSAEARTNFNQLFR